MRHFALVLHVRLFPRLIVRRFLPIVVESDDFFDTFAADCSMNEGEVLAVEQNCRFKKRYLVWRPPLYVRVEISR